MKDAPQRICFVCLGNICRSPTAEGVMLRLVADAGLEDRFQIESAGTAAYHVGEKPDKRARAFAAKRGITLPSRARQFVAADFDRFDWVLAMDGENLSNLEAILPDSADAPGQLSLLRAFDPVAPPGAEVPDPYYGGDAGFEEVLDLCEAACRGLIQEIEDGRA
ncbi:MAG: low molecular weight protein-tyrosine-phosphatase [Myxococcota bacterium]